MVPGCNLGQPRSGHLSEKNGNLAVQYEDVHGLDNSTSQTKRTLKNFLYKTCAIPALASPLSMPKFSILRDFCFVLKILCTAHD